MLIDWFTVGAQVLNFLILVGLLKYFLYDRIISAMDRREEKIRSRLESAEEKERAARKEEEAYREKRKEIDGKKEQILSEARDKAEERRGKMIQEARRETEALREKWRDALEREKAAFVRELRDLTGRHVHEIARRALSDLAEADVEKQAVSVFLRRIEELDESGRRRLAAAMEKNRDRVRIRSGFDLSAEQQERITEMIRSVLSGEAAVSFEVVPELILGVEIQAPGHKLAWNMSDYLDDLEARAGQALEAEIRKGAEGGREGRPAKQNASRPGSASEAEAKAGRDEDSPGAEREDESGAEAAKRSTDGDRGGDDDPGA